MELGIGRRLMPLVLALATSSVLAFAAHAHAENNLPIVFVHGGAGSGVQYASMAKRFAANGYPIDRIRTYEYDSSSGAAIAAAPAGVEALVDQLRAEYGVDRVNLVGHSLGTTISTTYLSDPARAAKIAHYVGVDGRSIPTCGVGDKNLDCMGIFRGSTGDVGGNNVYYNGSQSHVEAATSPESFAHQFKFFTGKDPATTLIVPEPPGQVEIAGRAVNFPQNTGVDGATVRIWEVDALSGARTDPSPVATITLGPSGAFGPVKVNGQQHYEFELRRPDSPRAHHLYYQPFLRDDYFIRLLSSPPDSPILLNTASGPNHAAAVVIRNREWWTTHKIGNEYSNEDTLFISTESPSRGDQPPVNALKNVISDGVAVGLSPVGIHVHDNPTDGVSSLAIIPFFATQAFQTGVDVYMPAALRSDGTPDGVITFRNDPRGDSKSPQILNVPNWPSDKNRITVQFNDYVQDINSWGECKRAKPISPCK